ncbi:MAG: non-heme iron oxygenase ferredoxin subunit [Actinomycetota bacterium]
MAENGWVRVASADDLKPGHIAQVFVDEEPVALACVDGEFLATHDICSHEYAEMHDGWIEGDEIECPLHGSRFSMRTGQVRNLPATQPIDVYEVKVDGGDVYVRAPHSRGSSPDNPPV